jgi:DNA-binding XRE family transcriptional regulator
MNNSLRVCVPICKCIRLTLEDAFIEHFQADLIVQLRRAGLTINPTNYLVMRLT